MTGVENAKFCGSSQKKLVDFSNMSDWSFLRIEVKQLMMGGLSISRVPKKIIKHIEKKTKEKEKEKKATYTTLPITTDLPTTLRIFPNPVPAGSNIKIEWKQTGEDYYHFQLINASGQDVHQKEIWIDREAGLLNFDLSALASGSYFLVLTNKITEKKFSEKVIVQQEGHKCFSLVPGK